MFTSEDGIKQARKRARNALEDVCEEFNVLAVLEGELSTKNFEDILELGYR